MLYFGYVPSMPMAFEEAVFKYGNCPVPTTQRLQDGGEERKMINGWTNKWLVQVLFDAWRHEHAKVLYKPATKFRYFDVDPSDWRAIVMNVMNDSYTGSSTYEWREKKGNNVVTVKKFDVIEDTKDKRLNNPAIEYLFSHPEVPVVRAYKAFKKTLG